VHHRNIRFCQAFKDVRNSYDALIELLESIELFLFRLDIYKKISLTVAMTERLVKILVEVLSILALATREVRQGKLSEFANVVVLLEYILRDSM
jgi:hypothetical protein